MSPTCVMSTLVTTSARSAPERNRLRPEDRTVHDWYRFVLSFPSHLVRDYLDAFRVDSGQRVLDPFCGTGTTLVECKKLGIPSVGIERNPMAGFASRTKLDWGVDPDTLVSHAKEVGAQAIDLLENQGINDFGTAPLFPANGGPINDLQTLPPDKLSLLLKNSISPLPLHKTLLLLGLLDQHRNDRFRSHERLALAAALVSEIGNLHFGPEVGVRRIQKDAPVIGPWLSRVTTMGRDLGMLRGMIESEATVHLGDARRMEDFLEPSSIDVVITSPAVSERERLHADDSARECAARLRWEQTGSPLLEAGTGPLQYAKRVQGGWRRCPGQGTRRHSAHRPAHRSTPPRAGQDIGFRTPVRESHEAVLRRDGPAPGEPQESIASGREACVRRRRSSVLPEGS